MINLLVKEPTPEEYQDALEQAQDNLSHYNLSADHVLKNIAANFKGPKPDFYLRTLNLYLKHSNLDPNFLDYQGPKNQPILSFNFLDEKMIERLKIAQFYSQDYNLATEPELLLNPEIDSILHARSTLRVNQERQIANQKRKQEMALRKIKFQEQAKIRKEAELTKALKVAEIAKQNKNVANQEKVIFDEVSIAHSILRNLKHTKPSELQKACQIYSQHLVSRSYPSNAIGAEKFFEDVVLLHKERFQLKNWFIMHRQYSLIKHGRMDLIYRNTQGELLVVEIENGETSKDHFSKSLIYRRQLAKELNLALDKISIMLISNYIDQTIQEECDHQGIKYSVIDRQVLESLIIALPTYRAETSERSYSRNFHQENSYGEIMNGTGYQNYIKRQSILRR